MFREVIQDNSSSPGIIFIFKTKIIKRICGSVEEAEVRQDAVRFVISAGTEGVM